MKMRKFSLFITVAMILGTFITPIIAAPVDENSNDLSPIVKSVEMVLGGEDHFGKSPREFNGDSLKISLSYDKNTLKTPIKRGDKLKIEIVPVDSSKDFIYMDYNTSILNELVDNSKNPPEKVADIDMTERHGADFTFTGEDVEFDANMKLPFIYRNTKITEYFKKNPNENEVTFKYKLQINGKDVEGKVLEYIVKKPKAGTAHQKFGKTNGVYNREGELGDGYFLYNINIDTELRSPNEYVIYDAPDVNLGFEGYLYVADGENSGQLTKRIFSNYNTDPNSKFTDHQDNDSGTKVKAYDVYYVSKEPISANDIRVPEWEEKTLTFNRADVKGGSINSMENASVPKNILFEKPLGTKLTDEEQKKIDEAGGLYKKVGKGFKVTITDYKSNYLEKGGHITLVYKMRIKNTSPKLNSAGNPVYKNFATYYADEIPTCDPDDEKCVPIKSEKTKTNDWGSPEKPIENDVKPGTIGADVKIPELEFTKVEADENGNALNNKPLGGAKFTIYKGDAQGNKIEIAKNKEDISLENLITDKDGKLTKDGNKIKLKLDKGYYIFHEIDTPRGYEIINEDTLVTISYKANSIFIANKKKGENPKPEDPKPEEPKPENPPAPSKPDEPSTPLKPDKPIKPDTHGKGEINKANNPKTGDNENLIFIITLTGFMTGLLIKAKKGILISNYKK